MSDINKLVNESITQALGITPERAISAAKQAAVWGIGGGYLGHKASEEKKKKQIKDIHLFKPIKKDIDEKEKERIKLKRKKIGKIVGAGALAGGLGALV
jgi:hypothetical protein